jgi:hypothetical protein
MENNEQIGLVDHPLRVEARHEDGDPQKGVESGGNPRHCEQEEEQRADDPRDDVNAFFVFGHVCNTKGV